MRKIRRFIIYSGVLGVHARHFPMCYRIMQNKISRYRTEGRPVHVSRLLLRSCLSCWSFPEKTFVKQSMILCPSEILLKIDDWWGGRG